MTKYFQQTDLWLEFEEKLPILYWLFPVACNYFPQFSPRWDESEESFIFQLL